MESIVKMTGGVIRQQQNTILKNVNIDIKSGEFIYLIGKVGSGKSSLLKTFYAELPLEYGTAEVAGFQLKKIKKSQISLLRRKCGIVFQDFKLLTDRNVYANLEFVLRATGWKNKKAIEERLQVVLEKVGMLDKKMKMPHQLSGGEQQRIVLARALLNAPPLILADEPTGNIDPETSYQLIQLLKEICETGKTIIIATHQYDLIEKYPGRVFCCENGEIHERLTSSGENCECEAEDTIVLPNEDEQVITEEYSVSAPETNPEESISGKDITTENPMIKQPVSETVEIETKIQQLETFDQVVVEETETVSMLGKLEFPEVTAFDYEQETLPKSESITTLTEEDGKFSKITGQEQPAEPEAKKPQSPTIDLELID